MARWMAMAVALALLVTMAVTTSHTLFSPTDSAAEGVGSRSAGAADRAVEGDMADVFGALPLSFIPNAGQADPRVQYAAQGSGFAVSFTREEALLSFVKGDRGHTLALRFLEANPQAALTARQELSGTVNYLVGDPAQWRTGLPTYQEVVYRDLWPGVDAVFRGGEGRLKYEFHLAPGARAGDVRLGYRGADRLALGEGGELLIQTPLGTLRDASPLSYQQIGGSRTVVESRYVLGPDGTYGFALGPGYDPRRPLVIDPELVYSTFLGGLDFDYAEDVGVDRAGHAYITGEAWSGNFPITPGVFDPTTDGDEAFVTKLMPDGSGLVYSTYLGGTGEDTGTSIRGDSAGHAYVAGWTVSSDFPTTPDAFDPTPDGSLDGFVTKLSPDGSALVYSTFLGGSDKDWDLDLTVDSAGHAYITGETWSADFPTTPEAFDTSHNGWGDSFVAKLTPEGSALVYSTFLGGSSDESDGSIDVRIGLVAAGHAYISGFTRSPDFPTTPEAFDPTYNGEGDAFVTKLSPDGSALVYSTFLGGTSFDGGRGIAVDTAGHAYDTGVTASADFPTTPGAFDPTYNGNDAFVTKLTPDGSTLVYSTFLGGGSDGYSIAVPAGSRSPGQAHVTGFTRSPDFPTTPEAFDPTYNGEGDAFVTKLSPDGSALVYSTFLGGGDVDVGYSIAVLTAAHPASHVYVTGWTRSPDFPTAPEAFDPTYNGEGDAFVSKFVIGNRAP